MDALDPGRRLVGPVLRSLLAAVLLTASCSADGTTTPGSIRRSPVVLTPDSAAAALAGLDVPAAGGFDGGEYDVGEAILRGQLAADGHLSAGSWDVYVVLDNNQIGAWGAGMDVWDSPAAAQAGARDQGTFYTCAGPRTPVELPAGDDDVLEATVCRKPGGDGFRATASASDDVVSRNLTVAARSRAVTERGLVAVWQTLSATSDELLAELGRD